MRFFAVLAMVLLAAACASPSRQTARPDLNLAPAALFGPAHMVQTRKPLQCVPHARALSGLPIRGDAWSWWQSAEGRYLRGSVPQVGAVLVLRRTERLRRGHLAVVTNVVGPREVLTEHANWLNQGMIHRNLPVIDVSPANDWSAVRVWYVPGNTLGVRSYPAHGFIYPVVETASN